MDTKIPISVCEQIAKEYKATEVILIARLPNEENNIKVVTYGVDAESCGFAAIAGRQLSEVIKRQPRSLEDALLVASQIRLEDITS